MLPRWVRTGRPATERVAGDLAVDTWLQMTGSWREPPGDRRHQPRRHTVRFSIIEVPSREEALAWAARIARGCRCAQEVREIMYDPTS